MKNVDQCPVCGEGSFTDFGRVAKAGELHFAQVKCSKCALIISQPQAEPEEMESYYRNIYYQEKWPEDTVELASAEFHFKRIVKLLNRNCRSLRVLDIGCGYGKMLHLFQKSGNTCSGCDPSSKAVSFARRHFGLRDVVCGDSESYTNGAYDVVLSFHVIEHTADPLRFVRRLAALTAVGGCVVIGTESAESAQTFFERTGTKISGREPEFATSQEHTYVFNRKNLAFLLERAGLANIRSAAYNEIPREMGKPESFHWALYKGLFRLFDKITGRGSYILAAGDRIT